jgi:micrococcal nuclease
MAVTGAHAEHGATCTAFDSQIWAQTVFNGDPARHASLDLDKDRLACEELAPGAAPVPWTNQVPTNAIPVDLVSVTDGDTIDISLNGGMEQVRLVGVDARESGGPYQGIECFGPEGAQYLAWLLGQGGRLYIEKDQEERDRFGRLLRWVWLDRGDGEVYLVNEAMIRAGFAERFRDTPNRRYVDELIAAEEFARRHRIGLWGACDESVAQDGRIGSPPLDLPDADCHPAYPEICIPAPPPDLACGDVPYSSFRVLPPDPHHFDGNLDGVACEGPS